MTIDEWRNDKLKLGEHHIPLWKFLRITHYYTERVGIYVVSGDNWQKGDHDFGFLKMCSRVFVRVSIRQSWNGC